MCGGVKYIIDDANGLQQVARIQFPQPYARIPVIHKGKKRIIVWGRRENENENTNVPQTGWARLTSLNSGYWQKYEPERVLIPAIEFSEKGNLPKSRWFAMPSGVFIMGLQIEQSNQYYVYVVTNPAAYGLEDVHPRMPHLVHEDFSPAEATFNEKLEKLEQPQKFEQQKLF